jgi:TolA-binding protein
MPIEEARNCALAYVRRGGKFETQKPKPYPNPFRPYPNPFCTEKDLSGIDGFANRSDEESEKAKKIVELETEIKRLCNRIKSMETSNSITNQIANDLKQKVKSVEAENNKLRTAMRAIADYVKAGKRMADMIFAADFGQPNDVGDVGDVSDEP